jgi:hypothetical protein
MLARPVPLLKFILTCLVLFYAAPRLLASVPYIYRWGIVGFAVGFCSGLMFRDREVDQLKKSLRQFEREQLFRELRAELKGDSEQHPRTKPHD